MNWQFLDVSVTNQHFKALINRLNEIIHSHLDDEKFGVKELAKEAGINRSHLHRRVKKHNRKIGYKFQFID